MKVRKIVLTGGPGAGKTTMAEVLDRTFPEKLVFIPESASLLFKGGFPRWSEQEALKSTQRAIYHTQIELEACYDIHYPGKVLILDRATVDGATYWPGSIDNFFLELNTTSKKEFARYDKVLYLECATEGVYEEGKLRNNFRQESWEEAMILDKKNKDIWKGHPSVTTISNRRLFSEKVFEVLSIVETAIKQQ